MDNIELYANIIKSNLPISSKNFAVSYNFEIYKDYLRIQTMIKMIKGVWIKDYITVYVIIDDFKDYRIDKIYNNTDISDNIVYKLIAHIFGKHLSIPFQFINTIRKLQDILCYCKLLSHRKCEISYNHHQIKITQLICNYKENLEDVVNIDLYFEGDKVAYDYIFDNQIYTTDDDYDIRALYPDTINLLNQDLIYIISQLNKE